MFTVVTGVTAYAVLVITLIEKTRGLRKREDRQANALERIAKAIEKYVQ